MNQHPGTIEESHEKAANILFPEIKVSRGVTAPAQLAAERKNLVMVGAGSGIAPFLAFLDEEQL